MTRCSITCAEPGCDKKIFYEYDKKIFYEDGDCEVPLYCERHRTEKGRHSAMKNIKPKTIPSDCKPEPMIQCKCPNGKCNQRAEITKAKWMAGNLPMCVCGNRMIYHKDLK